MSMMDENMLMGASVGNRSNAGGFRLVLSAQTGDLRVQLAVGLPDAVAELAFGDLVLVEFMLELTHALLVLFLRLVDGVFARFPARRSVGSRAVGLITGVVAGAVARSGSAGGQDERAG